MCFLWSPMKGSFSRGIEKDYEVRVFDGNVLVLF